MPPEALAPARFPDASALDAASVSDEEAFLARARETAMEKLRRRRRVQKRREEKTAVASFRPIAGGEKKARETLRHRADVRRARVFGREAVVRAREGAFERLLLKVVRRYFLQSA